MLESKSCGCDFSIIIKINIGYILFSANTISLAAVALYLDFNELFHLLIKIKSACNITSASLRPFATFDKVLERSNP